ncbi:SpoIIAA family protein [Neorhodopirellula lusitana]|uniref:STAS/SEC14 domain-containing protein n=1 Tax=Neorhodopirellula lusitana TaxID=445327 RepID=UPI00384B0D71
MSFALNEIAAGKVIEVDVTGKLTKEAYAEFMPMTEERIKEHGKVRILFVMHDFHGWDMGAAWEDIKFDMKHFNDIERLAIVGESKWEKGMSVFCRPFTTAEIKYFDIADVEKAREWIEADM